MILECTRRLGMEWFIQCIYLIGVVVDLERIKNFWSVAGSYTKQVKITSYTEQTKVANYIKDQHTVIFTGTRCLA